MTQFTQYKVKLFKDFGKPPIVVWITASSITIEDILDEMIQCNPLIIGADIIGKRVYYN